MNSRLFFIGPGRELDAAITLKHDHNLKPAFDETIVVSRDDVRDYIQNEIGELTGFTWMRDHDFMRPEWSTKGDWIAQQMMKLAALDRFEDDPIVIQDCDLFAIKEFDWSQNFLVRAGRPQLKTCGLILSRLSPVFDGTTNANYYYITELMPVRKADFLALKKAVEQPYPGIPFLDAVWHKLNAIKNPPDRVWFSEYEMLGQWFMMRNPYFPKTMQDRFDLHLHWPNRMDKYQGERFVSNQSAVLQGEIEDFYTAIKKFNGPRAFNS